MKSTFELTSTDPIAKGTDRPVFAAWFGNFYDPYYTDMQENRRGVADVAGMGFNSIFLDSKLWDDFWDYYESGRESLYVKGQKTIIEAAAQHGLGVSFLAFYNVGDNLYPTIRDSLPRIQDAPVGPDGRRFLGYRHWSEAQRGEFLEHVKCLHEKLSGEATAKAIDEDGEERLPFYFYHSPGFIPSFDEDGRRHYLEWLKTQYTLDELNQRYNTRHFSFDELTHADFWVGREPYAVPAAADYTERSATLKKWADNARYKRSVIKASMARLVDDIRAYEPRFYLYSCLSQWKYLLTDWIHLYSRGLDLWDMGELLDSPSFYTFPADAFAEANAHVVPFEMAMMRSASRTGGFIGGLFLGRYIHNDVYAVHTPAECIASAFGSGAIGLFFYGFNGLDDGGNFGKWGEAERQSIRDGLDWFTAVKKQAGKRLAAGARAAILFPDASYMLTNPETSPHYAGIRNDSLGWYQQLADHGINADVLHPRQAASGALDAYDLLVLPSDPYYSEAPVEGLAEAVRNFVERGGKVLESASAPGEALLGIDRAEHVLDTIDWEERLIDNSPHSVWFPDGDALATYLGSKRPAIARNRIGKGEVVSFGLDPGFAYVTRQHLPVPKHYGYDNQYPLVIARRTPVDALLEDWEFSSGRQRGIERVPFENGTVWINHGSYPHPLETTGDEAIGTDPGFNGTVLAGHQAVFVPYAKNG